MGLFITGCGGRSRGKTETSGLGGDVTEQDTGRTAGLGWVACLK